MATGIPRDSPCHGAGAGGRRFLAALRPTARAPRSWGMSSPDQETDHVPSRSGSRRPWFLTTESDSPIVGPRSHDRTAPASATTASHHTVSPELLSPGKVRRWPGANTVDRQGRPVPLAGRRLFVLQAIARTSVSTESPFHDRRVPNGRDAAFLAQDERTTYPIRSSGLIEASSLIPLRPTHGYLQIRSSRSSPWPASRRRSRDARSVTGPIASWPTRSRSVGSSRTSPRGPWGGS